MLNPWHPWGHLGLKARGWQQQAPFQVRISPFWGSTAGFCPAVGAGLARGRSTYQLLTGRL